MFNFMLSLLNKYRKHIFYSKGNGIMKQIITIALAALTLSTAVLCGCNSKNGTSSGAPGAAGAASSQTDTTVPPVTDSTVQATGGKIHIKDNTLGDIWITELQGVPVNKLSADGFTADNTFKYYSENGQPASNEGVDVSSFSGDIDWAKVKESGVDFAMIRLGGRGYGDEGGLYSDDKAAENLRGAKAAGIKVGAYFYSQATTNAEAEEEAEYAKEVLGDTQLDYPLAFDWEIVKDDNARTDKVTSTQATECAVAFCEKVKSFGYIPMVYSASREFYFKYDLSRLKDYELWLVQYADKPDFYYKFSMWQYSESGHIDGIDGSVDLNISFKSTADYAK